MNILTLINWDKSATSVIVSSSTSLSTISPVSSFVTLFITRLVVVIFLVNLTIKTSPISLFLLLILDYD
jgi:hypothetical protein